MSNATHTNRTCPFLGLKDDSETLLAFPSIWNICYRSRPLASPNLKYQDEFCLCEHHPECPLFSSEQTAPLPRHIRAVSYRTKKRAKTSRRPYFFILLVAAVIIVLAWGQGMFSSSSVNGTIDSTSSLQMVTQVNTISPTKTITVSPTVLPTRTPNVIRTSTPTLILTHRQLDVPIGTDRKFLIHSVLEGENLVQYGPKYSTSLEAILAINHELIPPVWVGRMVVIPIGFTDVADLPDFEVYQVTEAGVTVEFLAQEFNVDINDLIYYNEIADGEILQIEDWLLIPHQNVSP